MKGKTKKAPPAARGRLPLDPQFEILVMEHEIQAEGWLIFAGIYDNV